MLEIQQQLANRFRNLHDSRLGPVFFIEHGLSEKEIQDLVAEVRSAIGFFPLSDSWWDTHSLPLLITATEVGYRYRGTGTDFWPVLEEELHYQINYQERQRIRDLFARAAKTYRGAHPPSTPWAEAFHLITWPITHALVPIEFHRPLALTLANLRINVTGLDNEEFYRAIRIAAINSSARFLTLLEDPNFIIPVARSLLGEENNELCPEIIHRIADDLAADDVARRGVATARRVQRTTSKESRIETEQPESIPPVKGTFQLRRREGGLYLEALFPRLEVELASRLRTVLRRRRYAPRLWGITTRVPSEQLLSGLPFAIKFMSVPEEDAPLLPGVEDLEIGADLRAALAAFNLAITPPLLFAVSADHDLGRLVHGPTISGHRTYWVLTAEPMAGLPCLGMAGPYSCYALDPADELSSQALKDLGFDVRLGISVNLAGAPMLNRDAPIPAFRTGDSRVVVPQKEYPHGMTIELDGSTVCACDDEIVRFTVPPGDHKLRISSGGQTRTFPFKGVSFSKPTSSNVCSINARSSELTVQALLSGRLIFSVESFAPLEGLEITAELEVAGEKISASAPLGPLPQMVSSENEPLATLLDDATRERITKSPSITVALRIASVYARSWILEHRIRPCWWSRQPGGRIVLMSELGELPFGEVTESEPYLQPASNLDKSPLETRLLAPIGLDPLEFGTATQFTTLCISQPRSPLSPPTLHKPRLLRRHHSAGNSIGIENLVESYLRWSLAETDTLIAEIRRRQVAYALDAWTAELCCGEVWSQHESGISSGDPWEILVDTCNQIGIARDSYVHLSRDDYYEITRLAVAEIRRVQPDLWIRFGPPCDLSAEDYEELDLACGRAYSELAKVYQQLGREEKAAEIEDGDPGATSDEWDEALERVKGQIELRPLAELLLPSDTAPRLTSLDPSVMSFDELVDELANWAHDARRSFFASPPPADTLKVILALWADPETAARLDWRGALGIMIAERPISRAARYLALRNRNANRGGGK